MNTRAACAAVLLCAALLRPATGAFDTTPMLSELYDFNWAVTPPEETLLAPEFGADRLDGTGGALLLIMPSRTSACSRVLAITHCPAPAESTGC